MNASEPPGHEKIAFTEERETLLVPLYSKAVESRKPDPILVDRTAEAVIDRVDYDFSALRVPAVTRVTLTMRAKKLDECVRDHLRRRDDALVLHLGCGLDARVDRVGDHRALWYDVDYPEVIEVRRRFYEETATRRMLGASVTDRAWMDGIERDGPAVIVAEGLLMYLHDDQVKELLLRLRDRFPGSEIAFDAFSRYVVRRMARHPSLRKTGASVHWGIDDPRDLEQWATGIRLLEEWTFPESRDIRRLPLPQRIMMRGMGAFRAARRAHRILRYRL